jgi:hypothetical protein
VYVQRTALGAALAAALLVLLSASPAQAYTAGVSGNHPSEDALSSAYWHQNLGLESIAVWIFWTPGQTQLTPDQVRLLESGRQSAPRVFANVTSTFRGPHARTAVYRAQMCSLSVDAARYASDVLLQNEPNAKGFFGPRYRSAADLVRLYAHCYPRLHAAGARVWGLNTAPSHDPAKFIERVGRAYKLGGFKGATLMDGFAHHPYPFPRTGELPSAKHKVFIGMGDIDRLRRVLCKAFGHTRQRCLRPILYTESGVTLPGGEPEALSYPDPMGWFAAAHRLAACQRGVVGLLTFQLWDSPPGLEFSWQSGLLDENRRPKPGIERVRDAIAEIRAGSLDCTPS